ncbi:hypothetical protein ACQBAR_03755 [Propionibacteriaceae bacterium Y1685]|uniref:hypothetical protein n=1 Tax=Microlunatus sp. Y1700 TaxID=3418487 RepID=UPI003B8165B6
MEQSPEPLLIQLRRVGNWINLSTPLGLGIARAGGCRTTSGPRGLHLASGYRLGFPYAPAFTVGNVLINRADWADATDDLLRHEEGHSWQWLVCAGLPFLPLYGAATVWSWLRTGDRGAGNVFEELAGLELGGYAAKARRPLTAGVSQAVSIGGDWLRKRWGRSRDDGRTGRAGGRTASAAGA